MKNLLLFIIICVLFVSACSSYNQIMKADANMRIVELGMSKDEVIQIMGTKYHRMGASVNESGVNTEVLGYTAVDAIYMLYFENNELKEFHKDIILPVDKVFKESIQE